MKRLFAILTAMMATMTILAVPSAVRAAAVFTPDTSPDPTFSCLIITDKDGAVSGYRYTFKNGEITVKPDQPLLMVHGEFWPYEVIIRDDRALVPIRPPHELLGADIAWDNAAKRATLAYNLGGGDRVCALRAGEATLQDKPAGGAGYASFPLDTPATLYHDRLYVPLRVFRDAWGMDVAWVTGFAYNPLVTIGWQPANAGSVENRMRETQAQCRDALKLLTKDTAGTGFEATYTKIIANITKRVDNMKATGWCGQLDIYEGPYPIIRYGDDVYFFYKTTRGGELRKVDFSDPTIFLPQFFKN